MLLETDLIVCTENCKTNSGLKEYLIYLYIRVFLNYKQAMKEMTAFPAALRILNESTEGQ